MSRLSRLLFALPFSVSLAAAAPAFAESAAKWGPWIEAGGFLSTERDRGEATAFMPLFQSGESLLFADVKGKLFSEGVTEGNFALGYRRMTAWDVNLGLWGGYDIRESVSGNTFDQAAFGIEALAADYDFRLNGFVPLADGKAAPGMARVELSGSQILLTGGRELVLGGFEGEVGWRLPLEALGADRERHEFRLYAGGYRFDDSDLAKPVQGPRLRAEWRILDAVPGLAGSRLSFESSFQHDSYRHDQWEAGFRLRIPLYGGDAAKTLSPVERRMAEPIIRDTDIVTAPSRAEKVADALTGTVFENVVRVDSTQDLYAATHAAGANSLVLLDGSAGAVAASGIVLDGDRTLAGGGSQLALRGVASGIAVTYTVPGAAPTLLGGGCGCDDMLLLHGSNTHVTGIAFDGNSGMANSGIVVGNNKGNIHLTNLSLSDLSGGGIDLGMGNGIVMDNVHMSRIGFAGVMANDRNTIVMRNSTMDDVMLAGLYLDTDNFLHMQNVEISNVSMTGALLLNSGNEAVIENAVFSGTGDAALLAVDGNIVRASGLTIRDTGGHGIDLYDNNTFILEDSLVENTFGSSLSAMANNDITVTGATFRDAGWDAIYLLEDNRLALSDTLIGGTIGGDLLLVNDFGNVLSGSGNENAATAGGTLCTAPPGGVSGSIAFSDGSVIEDATCH
ncbi:Parallel beta-helix repeat [Parvibaculum lavamentivorans DS-1]|uniref:Parallel beta-helix repeat n=1 Tax=Parvibaculum lavamentivorans (strain DS-1 / DSM 13023 / NCIMB 13966) TaxID=402881 RepID=A7HQN0_PARL1|nr:right-handed parallel beta-helix repeat-containing protein [Parvibaculum lavamentivorans]ABS62213.1 Parallel beta-helix repeat [Parvibaculum lavamentivorans DS-1]